MLQHREGSICGDPWLRLLRREVEALVKRKHGDNYLKEQQAETELSRINRELKRLKTQIAALAGTMGLEPATSDVTDLGSGLAVSMICLCFQ